MRLGPWFWANRVKPDNGLNPAGYSVDPKMGLTARGIRHIAYGVGMWPGPEARSLESRGGRAMAFGLSKTRVSPIAVDFGAASLKLLQVTQTEPPQLVAAAAAEVPAQVKHDADERHRFFCQASHDLIRQQPFKGRRAICSLPAHQTLIQPLELADKNAASIDDQVALQLREKLNVEPSRMVVRNFAIQTQSQNGKPLVICVAAGRHAIMRHIEVLSNAKLEAVGMHAEPVAVLRAFAHLYRRADDANLTTCFLDIGSVTTKLVIAHGNEMALAKTIHVAADHLAGSNETDSAAVARNPQQVESASDPIPFQIAQAPQQRQTQAAARTGTSDLQGQASISQIIHSQANPASASTGDSTSDPTQPGTATSDPDPPSRSALDPAGPGPLTSVNSTGDLRQSDALECLVDELQMALRFHGALFPQRSVDKLVFVGGSSRNVTLCQQLAQRVRIAAQLGDPLARVARGKNVVPYQLDMREPQPGWAVPMGLCLSETNL